MRCFKIFFEPRVILICKGNISESYSMALHVVSDIFHFLGLMLNIELLSKLES